MKILFDEKTHKYTATEIEMRSVTTILKRLAKPALAPAAVKATAEYIRDNNLDLKSEEGIKEAKMAHKKLWGDKANIGTMVHYGMELLAKEHIKHQSSKYEKSKDRPHAAKPLPLSVIDKTHNAVMKKFNDEFEITPEAKQKVHTGIASGYKFISTNKDIKFIKTEHVVSLIPTLKTAYAGTVDAIVEIDGWIYVLDYKTGGTYPEYLLQLAAYTNTLTEYGDKVGGALLLTLDTDDVKYKYNVLNMEGVAFYYNIFQHLMFVDAGYKSAEDTIKDPKHTHTDEDDKKMREEQEQQKQFQQQAVQQAQAQSTTKIKPKEQNEKNNRKVKNKKGDK